MNPASPPDPFPAALVSRPPSTDIPASAGAAGALPETPSADIESTLREVVETLAPLDRTPCSPGERAAAKWLYERLGAVAGVDVQLEDEPSWGTFPPTAVGLGLTGVLGALLGLRGDRRHGPRGRRALGTLLAAATFAGIVDEAHNGPRLLRRLVRKRRATVNLIARAGDRDAGRTLVVIAHHDAPQTGIIFDQALQRRVYERAPQVVERFKTPLPQWWFGLTGPLATLLGRRRLGLALGLLGTLLVADILRSSTVPGANDNLSGVASLVALAELLREERIPGLRILLVSCGAEETLQDGIRAFVSRHRPELDPETTCFVNLDTVGSPHLVLLEAEGPVRMEEYHGPWLRDLFERRAEALGIPLRRGYRARASTDSIIPSRAGYPTATLVSMADWLAPANYHLPTDIPANLDYATVADTVRLVHDVAGSLAAG
jgi:hypothetical protein